MQAPRGQPRADPGRRHAPDHLLDRPQPQRLQRLVIELAAVVLPHSSIVRAYST